MKTVSYNDNFISLCPFGSWNNQVCRLKISIVRSGWIKTLATNRYSPRKIWTGEYIGWLRGKKSTVKGKKILKNNRQGKKYDKTSPPMKSFCKNTGENFQNKASENRSSEVTIGLSKCSYPPSEYRHIRNEFVSIEFIFSTFRIKGSQFNLPIFFAYSWAVLICWQNVHCTTIHA